MLKHAPWAIAVGSLCLFSSLGCSLISRPKSELNNSLIAACANNDVATVKTCLEAGADPNAVDPNPYRGFRALTLGLESAEITQLLLRHGANPNLTDKNGMTPLTYAPSTASVAVFEQLIAAGGNVHQLDSDGSSLLHSAAAASAPEHVELLVRKGLDVNLQDSRGLTPLHHAAMLPLTDPNQIATLRALLKHGADKRIKDKRGKTPYDWAKKEFFASRPDGNKVLELLKP